MTDLNLYLKVLKEYHQLQSTIQNMGSHLKSVMQQCHNNKIMKENYYYKLNHC